MYLIHRGHDVAAVYILPTSVKRACPGHYIGLDLGIAVHRICLFRVERTLHLHPDVGVGWAGELDGLWAPFRIYDRWFNEKI